MAGPELGLGRGRGSAFNFFAVENVMDLLVVRYGLGVVVRWVSFYFLELTSVKLNPKLPLIFVYQMKEIDYDMS